MKAKKEARWPGMEKELVKAIKHRRGRALRVSTRWVRVKAKTIMIDLYRLRPDEDGVIH